jgi:hypothetical protein
MPQTRYLQEVYLDFMKDVRPYLDTEVTNSNPEPSTLDPEP